jgi:hypothetical protein
MTAKPVKAKWVIAGVAFFILTVWGTVAVLRFLQVDSCLDMGGGWDRRSRVCGR